MWSSRLIFSPMWLGSAFALGSRSVIPCEALFSFKVRTSALVDALHNLTSGGLAFISESHWKLSKGNGWYPNEPSLLFSALYYLHLAIVIAPLKKQTESARWRFSSVFCLWKWRHSPVSWWLHSCAGSCFTLGSWFTIRVSAFMFNGRWRM